MGRLFRSLKWLPATGFVRLREAKRGSVTTLWITTTGGVHINTMTGYRQQKPKFSLIKSQDLVDYYKLILMLGKP